MLEKEFYIAELVSKHMQGNINTAEQVALDSWLIADHANRVWFEEFSKGADLQEKLIAFHSTDETSMWINISSTIQQKSVKTGKINRLLRMVYKTAAAAIIILSLGLGAFYFTKSKSESYLANDIAPGKNSATLTLANGKKIVLSDAIEGKLAIENGVSISKNKEDQLIYTITGSAHQAERNSINTLSTSKGEQYQVILPDDTKVWLNAASSISYPASFAGLDQRIIRLSGEAYFEVAKDKNHPFIVNTLQQHIEVIGTHFNVNSYHDEDNTTTTLIEGSVKIATQIQHIAHTEPNKQIYSNLQVIKPGEKAETSKERTVVAKANIESALDWHRGDFVFDDEDFKATMREVARWYDVDIVFDPSAPDVLLPGGWISRSKNLSAVLKIMELTGKVHFKVEGRRVTVMK